MTPRTRAAIRRCLSSPRVVVGIVLIAAITLVALFAPWLAPHDPQDQDLLNTLVPPSLERRRVGGVSARHGFAGPVRALPRCSTARGSHSTWPSSPQRAR